MHRCCARTYQYHSLLKAFSATQRVSPPRNFSASLFSKPKKEDTDTDTNTNTIQIQNNATQINTKNTTENNNNIDQLTTEGTIVEQNNNTNTTTYPYPSIDLPDTFISVAQAKSPYLDIKDELLDEKVPFIDRADNSLVNTPDTFVEQRVEILPPHIQSLFSKAPPVHIYTDATQGLITDLFVSGNYEELRELNSQVKDGIHLDAPRRKYLKQALEPYSYIDLKPLIKHQNIAIDKCGGLPGKYAKKKPTM